MNSPTGDYAVFGINNITFSGSGSNVIGSIGTDGTVSSPSSGSGAVSGTIALDGSGSSGVSGTNVVHNPDPVIWPTVDQIITNTYPGPPSGWAWIEAHNNNANARTYVSNSATYPSTALNTTSTQVSAIGTSVKSTKGAIILPPGDYYLTSFDISGQAQFIIDNQGLSNGAGPGLVRIWEGNGSGGDKLSNPILYTANPPNPSLFRWYDNNPGGFQIDGNTSSGGSFYGVTAAGNGSFTITGGSYTYGAVIADSITVSGNSTVEFPSGTIGTITGPNTALWYGITQWKEVPSTTGVTFPDGTSN